jgi:hypothetical protein
MNTDLLLSKKSCLTPLTSQTAAFGYLFNEATSEDGKFKKIKNAFEKIKEALDWEQNYNDGYDKGAEFKQKRADDEATKRARIEKNPDSATTQESADVYKKAARAFDGPISDAVSLAADRNIVKAGPFVYGYYKGYTECKCVGVPRE